MKRFLSRTLFFSAIVLLLLALGEVIARRVPTSYATKNAFMANHGESIKTLILGSSHAYYGIKPELLGDSTFNLANVSQTAEYDLYLLQYYQQNLPNLRTVIIPISYFTFRDPTIEDSDGYGLAINYKTQMHLPVHSDFSPYNFEIYDFDGYRAKLISLFLEQPSNQCDSLGFGLGFDLATRSPNWESEGAYHASLHTIPASQRASEVHNALESIIAFCKQHRANIIFISTPTWHTYRQHLDETQYKEMDSLINVITSKHNVSYYDFSADTTFLDTDFHDVDHLSDVGAIKFTKLLRTKLFQQ